MIRRPPIPTLFPTPPLFRSGDVRPPHQGRLFLAADAGISAGGIPARRKSADLHRRQRRYERSRQGRTVRLPHRELRDRKSTRLNSSHGYISYAVFCLKKKKT